MLKVNEKTKKEVQVALRWAKHFPHRKEDVYPAFLEVRDIYRANGIITVDLIETAAQNKDSVLHRIVYADSMEVAARKHYRRVAGELVRAFEIEIIYQEAEPQRQKCFHLVSAPKDAGVDQGYQPMDKIIAKKGWRIEVVQRALKDLRAWEERYNRIAQLDTATDEVRVIIRKLNADIRRNS
jgi:hypothetical protein